jgi:hypothetical protein
MGEKYRHFSVRRGALKKIGAREIWHVGGMGRLLLYDWCKPIKLKKKN